MIGADFMGLLYMPTDQLVAVDINPDRLSLAQKLGVPEIYNSAITDRAELVETLKAREFDVVVDTSRRLYGRQLVAFFALA